MLQSLGTTCGNLLPLNIISFIPQPAQWCLKGICYCSKPPDFSFLNKWWELGQDEDTATGALALQFQRCPLTNIYYTREDSTSWPQTPAKKTWEFCYHKHHSHLPKATPLYFVNSSPSFFVTKNSWHPQSGGKKREHKNYYSLKMMTQTIGALQFHGPRAEPHLLNIRNSAMYTSSYIQIKFIN